MFNVVVGNPPYIQLNKSVMAKMYKNSQYTVFDKIGNLYCLFYIRGIELLKEDGYLAYITSNKWMKSRYGNFLRQYFSKYNVVKLIDFGGDMFDDAQVDSNIIIIKKSEECCEYTLCCDYKYDKINFIRKQFPKDGSIWLVKSESDIRKRIKEKIISQSRQIKDNNDYVVNAGIKTGYDKAFVIDKFKREEIINNCKTEDERIRTNKIIRPVLRGKDINHYSITYQDLYLISTFPAKNIEIDNYPSLKEYLASFGRRILNIGKDKGGRKKTNHKWFETQDSLKYYRQFDKEKIIYKRINNKKLSYFYLDNKSFMGNNGVSLITGMHLGYLTAFLNSNLFNYYFSDSVVTISQALEALEIYMKTIYVKDVTEQEDKKFKKMVYEIQDKNKNKEDTTELEVKINNMIYELYGLNEEEITEVESFN